MTLLTGLFTVWAVFAAILVLLMVYRGVVGMHEEDQIFLSDSGHGFEEEMARTVARLQKLRPYIQAASAIAGVLSVAVAGLWLYQRFNSF